MPRLLTFASPPAIGEWRSTHEWQHPLGADPPPASPKTREALRSTTGHPLNINGSDLAVMMAAALRWPGPDDCLTKMDMMTDVTFGYSLAEEDAWRPSMT